MSLCMMRKKDKTEGPDYNASAHFLFFLTANRRESKYFTIDFISVPFPTISKRKKKISVTHTPSHEDTEKNATKSYVLVILI